MGAKSLARVAARCHRMNHVAENRVSSSIVRNVDLRFRRERHGVREYDPRSVSEAFTESGLHSRNPSKKKREMIRLLRDEIRLESESQKIKLELPSVPGFEVTVDGSLLILTKDGDHENVKISVDVLNSLGREDAVNDEGEIEENAEPVFVAKPPFQDLFSIEQFFVHDGSTNTRQFVCLPRLVDPELYDRFMSMLAERGIDNDFVESLQELATAHEHRCYIRSLKDIVEFVAS